jgi:hypothetical protein
MDAIVEMEPIRPMAWITLAAIPLVAPLRASAKSPHWSKRMRRWFEERTNA